jgi:F-type H+-transporting ATPase subunit alpha
LRQPQYQSQTVALQITILLALTHGLFDAVPLERVADGEQVLRSVATDAPDLAGQIEGGVPLDHAQRERLVRLARTALLRAGLIATDADANP